MLAVYNYYISHQTFQRISNKCSFDFLTRDEQRANQSHIYAAKCLPCCTSSATHPSTRMVIFSCKFVMSDSRKSV